MALLARAAAMIPPLTATSLFPTAAELRAAFRDAKYVIDSITTLGVPVKGSTIRVWMVRQAPITVHGSPAVSNSIALISLEEYVRTRPHIHPRGSETLFFGEGSLRAFETGPPAGDSKHQPCEGVAVFPKGLIHGERCVARSGSETDVVFGGGDLCTVSVGGRLCDTPVEAGASSQEVSEQAAQRVWE